jgi:asparagine synthase (glutamine-hydrolysing)
MCGIAGIFTYNDVQKIDSHLLERMCKSLLHRGPDDEGIYVDQQNGVGLGHRRLSIIDLQSGHQPMTNETGEVWIVFNGEIYNYHELKKDLEAKGHSFKTTSDTEVIIHWYEEHGEKGFQFLNGIFAFAIYDQRNKSVIVARDHFGVKPLYFAFHKGSFLFASEIKAILQDETFPRELDLESLNSFLTFRYNPSPQTLFKNIKKLLPGHYLKITKADPAEVTSYWEYVPRTNNSISENAAVEEYQRLLEQAVRRQMISDVPVGLLLSGGIDSAVLGVLMSQTSVKKIQTFTIGFPGEGDYNELAFARQTARLIGSEHYDMEISQKDYMNYFFKSFEAIEEPIGEPTVSALYYVSKLASEHLKVVLAGQGADEAFAGYQRYIGINYINKFYSLFRCMPFGFFAGLLPRNERIKRAAYVAGCAKEEERFLATYTIFTPEMKKALFKKEILRNASNADAELLDRLYSQTGNYKDPLSKMLFIDARMKLSDDLLNFNDKITMANSLEMRVPFLDLELMEFIESLPASLKLRGLKGKYLHKKAIKKWLPDEIIKRKKLGFATPMDEWLQNDLADTAYTIFNDPQAASKEYFDIKFINHMLQQHKQKKEDYKRHIFMLLSFEIWHKNFF